MKQKERFKRIKKKSKTNAFLVQTFKPPDFMNKQQDICMVTETGLFLMKDQTCTMLYKITASKASNIKLFEVLRSYDFEYRFFYYGIEEIYLELWIKPDNSDFFVDIEKIEKELFSKLTRYGITLTAISLDDRLRLVHKKICQYNHVTGNNVMNYVNDISAWKEDIEVTQFTEEDYKIKAIFIKKFPQNNIRDFIQCMLAIEGIKCVMMQYSPVKDEVIRGFFKNTYMGCDNELRKLKKKDLTLYRVLSEDVMSDTMVYCFMGMSVLYLAQDKAVQEKIDILIDKFSVLIGNYSAQPNTLFEFVPFGKRKYNQCRLFLNKDINNTMPLSGECNGKERDYKKEKKYEGKENIFFM